MAALMAIGRADGIDEALYELEKNLIRLRVSYEQYFAGVLRRAPEDQLAKVQRTVREFMNTPPRNATQKFRFNQINAKFQAYRQMWGRTIRQIESGTYRPHRFRAQLREQQSAGPSSRKSRKQSTPASEPSGIDELAQSLAQAREKTGEATMPHKKLVQIIRQQITALRKKFGDRKVGFRVVIEDNRAKLKASVKKS